MKFDLVRPCAECPFRSDIMPYLRRSRIDELKRSLIGKQETFPCHKTVDYDAIPATEDGEGQPERRPLDRNEQHCAGALILLEKLHQPNQMMRWMERLTNRLTGRPFYDRTQLQMDAPIYDTFTAMRKAQTS